jgi:uncharacterized membrane protein YcjF (UPF0283 family)
MKLEDKFPHLRHGVPGERYAENPRERWLRVMVQLIDKPVFLLLVALSFALAARGPGWVIPGYQPSGWFVFGLWLCMTVALRLMIVTVLGRLRAALAIPVRTLD